jgi:Flp pilus assembly protein TadG
MLKLRNRRGAMLVLGAVLFVGLMVMAVLAVDFSRIVEQRNGIHTAADAGAHAGAVQLHHDKTTAVDSAIAYALRNMPSGAPTPTAEVGRWDDSTQTFTAGGSIGEANAVRVHTQRGTDYLIGNLVGLAPATMHKTSTAWSEAPVSATTCVKPWGIPYMELTKRLQPSNPDTLRDLTDDDNIFLQTLPPSALRFQLKAGPPPTIPGNFYALYMPNPDVSGGGAELYANNIGTCNPALYGIGSTIETETGNIVGKTLEGAAELCQPLVNHQCFSPDGTLGLPIKAVFWIPPVGGCAGKCTVTIKIIGSFVLDTVCQANLGPPADCSQGEIRGYFKQIVSDGQVGTVHGTVVRPILVQ